MLKGDYVITNEDAIECLNGLSSNIKQYYKDNGINIRFGYNNRLYSSSTLSNMMSPVKEIQVSVSIKRLLENAKDGYVKSSDFAYTVSTVFHEERHAYQRAFLYNDKNASQHIVDMAQCDVIGAVIPEYANLLYYDKPSEVDAELEGWKKCVEFFDTHFLDENGKPIIDARKELVNELHEFRNEGDFDWYGDINVDSYDAAIQSLEYNKNSYKRLSVNLFADQWIKNSKRFKQLESVADGRYADAYLNAATPDEARRVLYEFAVDVGEVSTFGFPCLKNSKKDVKSGERVVTPRMNISERIRCNALNPTNQSGNDFQRMPGSRAAVAHELFGDIEDEYDNICSEDDISL